MAQKYCTEIGSLFQVRNPAVTTHFFSFKELQLLEKKSIFEREYKRYGFSEQPSVKSLLWITQSQEAKLHITVS